MRGIVLLLAAIVCAKSSSSVKNANSIFERDIKLLFQFSSLSVKQLLMWKNGFSRDFSFGKKLTIIFVHRVFLRFSGKSF